MELLGVQKWCRFYCAIFGPPCN